MNTAYQNSITPDGTTVSSSRKINATDIESPLQTPAWLAQNVEWFKVPVVFNNFQLNDRPFAEDSYLRIGGFAWPDDAPLNLKNDRAAMAHARVTARILMETTIPHNPEGWTFDLLKCRVVEFGPRTNPQLFMVSRYGFEQRFSQSPSRSDLMDWLYVTSTVLGQKNVYPGAWWSNSQLYLDVSVPIFGFGAAVKFGRLNHQKAIFHPASGKNICLNSEAIHNSSNFHTSPKNLEDHGNRVILNV